MNPNLIDKNFINTNGYQPGQIADLLGSIINDRLAEANLTLPETKPEAIASAPVSETNLPALAQLANNGTVSFVA